MDYTEQLKEFLGPTVEDAELGTVAATVIAANVRGLKAAIAERVWQSRQRAASGDQSGSAAQLAEARRLKAEYDRALAEYFMLLHADRADESAAGGRQAGAALNGRAGAATAAATS